MKDEIKRFVTFTAAIIVGLPCASLLYHYIKLALGIE